MIQGLFLECGAAVHMDADHDGDVCDECGAIVKFRVQGVDGRLVFLAGALGLFTIEPNEIDTYEKTRGNFGRLSRGELNKVLSALEEEIAAAGEGALYLTQLNESRRAIQDLIVARNQTP